jgi:hypothetical protein
VTNPIRKVFGKRECHKRITRGGVQLSAARRRNKHMRLAVGGREIRDALRIVFKIPNSSTVARSPDPALPT